VEHWLLSTSAGSVVFVVIGLVVLILLYLLPTILGLVLDAPRPLLLLLVNGLLGWTVLVWIGCVVWVLLRSRSDGTFDEELPRRDRVEPRL